MTAQETLDRLWSDPVNWTQSGVYHCAADPRLMVLKRVGIGYTINTAHPRSWFLLGGLLVVAMAPLIANLALGRRSPSWAQLVTLLWPIAITLITLVSLSRRRRDS